MMFIRSNPFKCLLLAIVGFILYELIVYLSIRSNEKFQAEQLKSITDSDAVIPNIPVKVSVYYEALCPDSRHFVLHQLVPAYEKGSRIIDFELVPYGKAKTEELVPPGNRYKFECQHGVLECHANKIHACATHYIKDKPKLLKYVACMINDNSEPEQVAFTCSQEHNVDLSPVLACAKGAEGEVFLKNFGEMTVNLSPKVSFIPTVLINGNQYKQALILKNLWRSVCDIFPDKSQPEECTR